MVFSSSIFLFFFLPLVITGYYLLKENYRIYFLLFASLFFYAWGEPKFVLIMLLSIMINYTFGIFIDKNHEKKLLAKALFILTVACNLGILFYFKYLQFALNTVNRIFGTSLFYHNIIMPIGISFFTFQGMSYVIDLYLRKVDVQRNIVKIAFYISFFPQLIAGPIVRYMDIKEQIDNRIVSLDKFVAGIERFVIGLAKKIIIANTLGEVADAIFGTPPTEISTAMAWVGLICYMFQLYNDFSGYSDMAIGLGKMFGFEFLENFNYPFISKTITEFWRRWHMSLSSWFKDYLYIPLGGNRKGNVYVNLFFTYSLIGLWHGANLQFIAWGLWNGFFLMLERFFGIREIKNKKFVPLGHMMTMLIFLLGLILVRGGGIRYSYIFFKAMCGLARLEFESLPIWFYLTPKIMIMLFIAAVASTPLLKTVFNSLKERNIIIKKYVNNALILLLLVVCVVFVASSSYNPFIYFRF